MAPNNSSFPFSRPTGHDNTTPRTQDWQHCPPFANEFFPPLENTLPSFLSAALNVPLGVATTFANLVVLLAMRRVTSIRLPSKLLLCSLVLTDLGVGSVVQPQFAAFLFHRAIYPDLVPCPLYRSLIFAEFVFSIASLWTLAAISLDRYAALFFHLKYQQIVTTRRVCAVLAFIWAFSVFLGVTSLFKGEPWQPVTGSCYASTLLIISISFIKIFRRLRAQQVHPQAPTQAQQQAGNTLNMERYRRTASTMMWVFVLLIICYLPSLCVVTLTVVVERTALIENLWGFSYSLVLVNSLLNPFVYCLRLPEFRTEVVRQLHKLFCRPGFPRWTQFTARQWLESEYCVV